MVSSSPKRNNTSNTTTASASAAASSSNLYNSESVPDLVIWVNRIAKALEPEIPKNPSFASQTFPISNAQCVQTISKSVGHTIRWYAILVISVLRMKKGVPDDENDLLALLVTKNDEKLSEKFDQNLFLNPPDGNLFSNGLFLEFPTLDVAMRRVSANVQEYALKKRLSYDPMNGPNCAKWLYDVAKATYFLSVPYFLMVMTDTIQIEDPPETRQEREAIVDMLMPSKFPGQSSSSTVLYGWESGKAPLLTDRSFVCPVTIAAIKKMINGNESSDSFTFPDSLNYVTNDDIADNPDVSGDRLIDVVMIPWQMYSKMLSWYGGYPFVPLITRVDRDSGDADIVHRIQYFVSCPHVEKCDQRHNAYVEFQILTRDYDMTLRQLVTTCLEEGKVKYVDTRCRNVDEAGDGKTKTYVESVKRKFRESYTERWKAQMEAEDAAVAGAKKDDSTDTSASVLEIRSCARVTDSGSKQLKNFNLSARDALSSRPNSNEKKLCMTLYEAGTIDHILVHKRDSSAGSGSNNNAATVSSAAGGNNNNNTNNTQHIQVNNATDNEQMQLNLAISLSETESLHVRVKQLEEKVAQLQKEKEVEEKKRKEAEEKLKSFQKQQTGGGTQKEEAETKKSSGTESSFYNSYNVVD